MITKLTQNIPRKESWDKVTGKAVYTDDLPITNHYCARILPSPHASARIKSINIQKATKLPGVKAVITGQEYSVLCGPTLLDRPPLAKDCVRYAGEPVALVVALDEATALQAVRLIEVDYEVMTALYSPLDSLKKEAPLLHPQLNSYTHVVEDIYPIEKSNIPAQYHMKKGNIEEGFANSDVIVEETFHLPPTDHLAMEVRTARAEISKSGKVLITTSSQSPFQVAKDLAKAFLIPAGNIEVHVPFVGGAFGGKANVSLEFMAYMASKKVNGHPVRMIIPREEDMTSAPSKLGMEATIKIGTTKEGKIQAAKFEFYVDCGAYSDISPYMTKAIAADCTGPYNMENLVCDSYCVYTNHTYATSYRGFGHLSFTYCIERTLDQAAKKCNLDPLKFRLLNAIKPGDLAPNQVISTYSNTGNVALCLKKLKGIIHWNGPTITNVDENIVRTTGISCLWKAATPPSNAVSGALITFNSDGSLNLNTGVVEMGNGGQTNLAQILAEKLKMDINKIHVTLNVNTRLNPEHYKTVASISGFMAGNSVLRAADDIISQLKSIGSQVYSCKPEEIEVSDSKVYCSKDPTKYTDFKDIIAGYKTDGGASIGEPVLAKGGYMLKGITVLDPKTGKGRSGPSWTVGAQAVEIEFDKRDYTYRIINAVTVMDVGQVLNPDSMKEMIMGGMAMGLSMASREIYSYNKQGRLKTPNLRTYKLLHIGQEPIYKVDFVETPQTDAPFGTRSMSEHGIIGMPAALANALALASEVNITELPITPEYLWEHRKEKYDS